MLMVPPYLGAAPAKRGAPAASMPTAVPASTSRRVNGAPPARTTVPAFETDEAISCSSRLLVEPCSDRRAGMRACQHYLRGSLPPVACAAPPVSPARRAEQRRRDDR